MLLPFNERLLDSSKSCPLLLPHLDQTPLPLFVPASPRTQLFPGIFFLTLLSSYVIPIIHSNPSYYLVSFLSLVSDSRYPSQLCRHRNSSALVYLWISDLAYVGPYFLARPSSPARANWSLSAIGISTRCLLLPTVVTPGAQLRLQPVGGMVPRPAVAGVPRPTRRNGAATMLDPGRLIPLETSLRLHPSNRVPQRFR